MENFGKFMTIVLFVIIAPIINGFVFSKLWFWFIVPTFQVQPLRIIEAIGLILIINFIRIKKEKSKESTNFWEKFTESIIGLITIAGFALLFGWVVSLFL